MAAYLVTYDLNSPGQDYDALYARIKSYKWAKITESSWAVSTSQTAVQVRDHLWAVMDANDKLLVSRMGASAWYGLPDDVTQWLKDNIS